MLGTEYSKVKEFEKCRCWKGFSDLSFSPEVGPKTLIWMVLILFLKEGVIFVSEGGGHGEEF
jgi:hypothetical protein